MHLSTFVFQEVTGFVCGRCAPMNWDPWWTIWDGDLYSTSHYRTKGHYRKSFLGLHGASHSWNPLLCQAQLHFLGITPVTPTRNKMIRLSDFSSCAERWRINKNKRTLISVIIFYSHMLHFALNVQVILSGQTQKVWVSTYSNVLYSLLIHTGEPQELSVTIYTHYSLAIWLRSFTKWELQNKEKKLSKQKSSMHGFKRKFFFKCSTCVLKIPLTQHDVAQHLKTRCQQYAVYHSKKININLAGTTE